MGMMWFDIGFLLLTATTTYAWWWKIRVKRLRIDLLSKRDELFDAMFELGSLEDSDHKAARDRLTSLSELAKYMSIPVTFYLVSNGEIGHSLQGNSDKPSVKNVIDDVYRWTAVRITSYLLYETVSGIIVGYFLGTSSIQGSPELFLVRAIERWVRSIEPIEMERITNPNRKDRPSRPHNTLPGHVVG